ncbi:MAG: hypothetical protein AAF942_15320 [Pseudomonadota bacterium]
MRIVNPSFALEESEESRGAGAKAASADWSKDPIAIMSNSKANARELLEGVRAKMKAYRPVDDVDYFFKDSAAKAAPTALYDEIAKKYKGAIVALAD